MEELEQSSLHPLIKYPETKSRLEPEPHGGRRVPVLYQRDTVLARYLSQYGEVLLKRIRFFNQYRYLWYRAHGLVKSTVPV